MSAQTNRYDGLARTLHWLMALMILTLIVVGVYMSDLPKDDPMRGQLYGMHKAFGALTLILLVVRLAWLRVSPPPALPAVFDGKEVFIIKGVKSLLYLFMLLTPLSGYVMSTAAGYPISMFGLFDMPMLIEKNKELAERAGDMHEVFAFTMLLLVVIHAAGAVKHRLKEKGTEKDILARML